MTEKEIRTQHLELLEMIQKHEEAHVLHARMTHGRIHLLEQQLSLLLDLAGKQAGPERDAALSDAKQLFAQAETQYELKTFHSRIEAHHELIEHLIAQLRARIEDL